MVLEVIFVVRKSTFWWYFRAFYATSERKSFTWGKNPFFCCDSKSNNNNNNRLGVFTVFGRFVVIAHWFQTKTMNSSNSAKWRKKHLEEVEEKKRYKIWNEITISQRNHRNSLACVAWMYICWYNGTISCSWCIILFIFNSIFVFYFYFYMWYHFIPPAYKYKHKQKLSLLLQSCYRSTQPRQYLLYSANKVR